MSQSVAGVQKSYFYNFNHSLWVLFTRVSKSCKINWIKVSREFGWKSEVFWEIQLRPPILSVFGGWVTVRVGEGPKCSKMES